MHHSNTYITRLQNALQHTLQSSHQHAIQTLQNALQHAPHSHHPTLSQATLALHTSPHTKPLPKPLQNILHTLQNTPHNHCAQRIFLCDRLHNALRYHTSTHSLSPQHLLTLLPLIHSTRAHAFSTHKQHRDTLLHLSQAALFSTPTLTAATLTLHLLLTQTTPDTLLNLTPHPLLTLYHTPSSTYTTPSSPHLQLALRLQHARHNPHTLPQCIPQTHKLLPTPAYQALLNLTHHTPHTKLSPQTSPMLG